MSRSADNTAADQLIDLITAEQPDKYQLIVAILRKQREKHINSGVDIFPASIELALGRFLDGWIKIEKRIRELTQTDPFRFKSTLPNRSLEKYGIDASTARDILEIRGLRNGIVHGQFLPSQEVLVESTDKMAQILKRLNNGS